MASIARRLGRWTTITKEPEETIEEASRAPIRQSVDSHYSTLSGLESLSRQSTHLTYWSRSNRSSATTVSEPKSPSQNAPKLRHKMSSVFSYVSETIRSTTSIFHPLEAGTASSAPSVPESTNTYRRHCTPNSTISGPFDARKLSHETTEFETPKKHRRYSSVISSCRSRLSLSSPRTRETQKCALSSPTTPVRAPQERPPQLDVKIPSYFLRDERSRSTVTTERIPRGPLSELFDGPPREATTPCVRAPLRGPCKRPPDVDGGFDTEESFQSMLGNDRHGLPNISNAGMKASHEVLPATPDNATPGSTEAESTQSLLAEPAQFHLAACKELKAEVKRAQHDLTLPYRPVPPTQFNTSDPSSPRNILSPTVPSQHAHSRNMVSQRQSCSDSTPFLESEINLCDQLLSPGAYEADVSSCGTSPEHPSMGDRAAIAQRRADREKRYLETTLEGPDTESDDNSQSALELSRVPAANDSNESLPCSETMRDDPANASDMNWKINPPSATRHNSELAEAVIFGPEVGTPAAKALTMDRNLIPNGDFHYAVEAIERASGDTIWPIDISYAVDAIEVTPSYMAPAFRDNDFDVERAAWCAMGESVPSAPKNAMMSMCLTPEDFVALKPKQSEDKGFPVMPSTDLFTDVPLELLTTNLLPENEFETESGERPGPENIPRICCDIEFWQKILFPESETAEHRQETEEFMSYYFGISLQDTSQKAYSSGSANPGVIVQSYCASRRDSLERNKPSRHKDPICSSPVSSSNSDGSPRFIPSPQFGIKPFQLSEGKSTAYMGYRSDDELASKSDQGSPANKENFTPGGSSRGSGQRAVCFAKDVEIINRHGQVNLSPRKPSPARPAKQLSAAETARKVQRDLEVRNEAAVQRLCQRIQGPPGITLEEPETPSPDRTRWRVP